jgi:hypothetical protein
MQTQKKTFIRWTFSIILLAIASLSFAWVYNQNSSAKELPGRNEVKNVSQAKIDEKAKKIMMDMSNYVTGLTDFSFRSKGYFEVIDSASGKKEKMDNSGELFTKRPNKIMVKRTGEKADLTFYCDGKQVTMYEKKSNDYSSAPVSGNLDDILDEINEKFNISLPASDLLYTDLYEGIMQDVVSGKYIGKEKAGNVTCDHISFTGKEVDWQMWVEDGEKKLPRKYVITSKQIQGKPQAVIEIMEWKTDVKLEDKMFTFTPPKGSKKMNFKQLKTEILTRNK